MLHWDWLGFTFSLLFIFGAAITSLFAMEVKQLGTRGEFYLLLLAATLGMTLMASSADLIMLFLAIEMTSIPLYVMAGFYKTDNKSTRPIQVPAIWRHDFGRHAIWFQPVVWLHRDDRYVPDH
jgi:NADH:ubiquinone oxidoreductase subunit 2 (subunit N)